MDGDNQETVRPNAIFAYSFYLLLLINLVLLVVFVPVLIGSVLSASLVGSLAYGMLDLLLIGSTLRVYSTPVHHARFFDNHFEVQGRRLNKSIGYDKVDGIEKVKAAPLHASRMHVLIIVQGESPLVIPGKLAKQKPEHRPIFVVIGEDKGNR